MTEEVLSVLRGGGLGERVRRLLIGGLSASQVLDRLPSELVASLSQETNPVLARREAVRAVTFSLDELVQRGQAQRGRARLANSLVDVYR